MATLKCGYGNSSGVDGLAIITFRPIVVSEEDGDQL